MAKPRTPPPDSAIKRCLKAIQEVGVPTTKAIVAPTAFGESGLGAGDVHYWCRKREFILGGEAGDIAEITQKGTEFLAK